MTEARLLQREAQGVCREADVRAFLYHTMNLNNLFAGDGYTYTPDGRRGHREYLAANVPRDQLERWATCPLGAPTLDECMQEIQRAYAEIVNVGEH